MAKWFENESVRKEEWIPGGEEIGLWIWNVWKVDLRLCRLRTVPLLAVLTEFEQY